MPGLNQQGPDGQGSMTGRRMGRCTNFGNGSNPNQTRVSPYTDESISAFGREPGLGRGARGRGHGRGRGMQNRFRGGQ